MSVKKKLKNQFVLGNFVQKYILLFDNGSYH